MITLSEIIENSGAVIRAYTEEQAMAVIAEFIKRGLKRYPEGDYSLDDVECFHWKTEGVYLFYPFYGLADWDRDELGDVDYDFCEIDLTR